ncbi:MAG: hypothetical protein V7K94_08140 [Nostoc sp.]|uniref:hypothetical protein n=1 Tax=Nostoc sp. TaxID=1180 RepID=UPI002FFB3415
MLFLYSAELGIGHWALGIGHWAVADFQQIIYPILWGGQHDRPYTKALMLSTPQEAVEYFLFGSPLRVSRRIILMQHGRSY